MKLKAQRLIAILLLVVPGVIACLGFLNIKNAIFDYIALHGEENVVASLDWVLLFSGIIMFLAGVFFIAGWVFFRDRKRNYVAPKFKEKREKPAKPTKPTNI